MAQPLIIAHRGASAEKPENTLAAFHQALAARVDGIELDVQLTSDGVPVVFHDATLRRLTGRPGRLVRKTWTELVSLRVLGTSERIPQLAEVLSLTRTRAVVQIELKKGVRVAPVLTAVRAAKAVEWVIFASFEPSLIRDAARLAPEIPRMLISEGRGGPARLLRQLAGLGAGGLSVNHRAVTGPDFVQAIQSRGVALWCWTVNDAARARQLAGWGVNGLLGDNPDLLKL